jgi:hypothetical protein
MRKIIIAGSRTLEPVFEFINEARIMFGMINASYEIVSGGAEGVDTCGENFAKEMGWKLTVLPADWNKHGKAAGPIRNRQMVEYADELLLIWDGESKGSKNMKEEMKKLHKPIYEVILKRG